MKRVILSAVCVLTSLSCAASADAWPSKAIRFVVPFTAGGSADLLARIVGEKLSLRYGKPVVIDNRPGAGGHIGAELVAKAAPDGYTVVLGTSAVHAAYGMYPKLRYDPSVALVPVTLIGDFPNVLVVNKGVPATNMKEFMALVRSKPGGTFFGSAGNGSSTHMSGELFKQVATVDIRHVPYRGSSAAMNDLAGGQIQMMFENLPTTLSMIQSGRIRALGVTSSQRSASLPDVPPISDTVPGYDFSAWFTIAVPAGTPPEIVNKLNADLNAVIKSPELVGKWKELGVRPIGGSLPSVASFIESEKKKFTALIREAKLSADE